MYPGGVIKSGVGANRTLVQTSDTTAFYKFSSRLIFEYRLTENCLSIPYLLSFETLSKHQDFYVDFNGALICVAVNKGRTKTSYLPTWWD